MRVASGGRQVSFKSKLLVGAVGLTTAAMGSAAFADPAPAAASSGPAVDPPKWLPYAEVGGQFGSSGYSSGNVDIVAPITQDMNSLLFVQLDAATDFNQSNLFSFGAGYRTKIDPDWIVGGYANWDSSQTKFGHTFQQGNLGAELMSVDWDVRVNGYLTSNNFSPIANKYGLFVTQNTIAILQGQEVAYSGFDGEVGYRVFGDDSTDVRLFAGGFMFNHDNASNSSTGQSFDFPYRTISGPKARAEVTLYDIDMVGLQSRLAFDGEIEHDNVRGTTGYVGAELRIPLHAPSAAAQALDALDRRMVDPERRQENVLTRWEYSKPEPVVVYGSHFRSQPTNSIYYVDNTKGAGTYANPTTLSDATTRGGSNALIVITSKQGAVTGGVTMQTGQDIIGGGETFEVVGATSHTVFKHDFAPGTTDPTVVPAKAGGNVITMANNTIVYGFAITGDFGNALYVHNATGVTIADMTINGGGKGETGVYIKNDKPGTFDSYIYHTSVSDVVTDGIAIFNDAKTPGTITASEILKDVNVSDAGYEGIHVYSYAIGTGAMIDQYVGIHNSSVSGSGFDNIRIQSEAGPGGTITQHATVDPTTTTGGVYGIAFDSYAFGGGKVGQYATVTDFTATGQTDDGVLLDSGAAAGGTDVQTIHLSGVVATGATDKSYGNGVRVNAYGEPGGTIVQTLDATGLSATGNAHDGVKLYAHAYGTGAAGSTLHQYANISGATLDGNGHDGLYAYAKALGNVVASQDLVVSNSDLSHNADNGLLEGAVAEKGASVFQGGYFVGATFGHNATDGAYISANSNGAAIVQGIYFKQDTFETNGYDGVRLENAAVHTGYARQDTRIELSEIDGNTTDGVSVIDAAYAAGDALQSLTMSHDDISENGRDGIYVYTESLGLHGTGAHAIQAVRLFGDTISGNGGDGIEIIRLAEGTSDNEQTLYVGNSAITDNGGHGIYLGTVAVGYGAAYSALGRGAASLVIVDSSITDNGKSGIETVSYAGKGSYLDQYVFVENSSISNNKGFGIYGANVAKGGFLVDNVVLYGYKGGHVTVDGNGMDGISIRSYSNGAYLKSSGIYDTVAVTNSDVENNGGAGVSMYLFGKETYRSEEKFYATNAFIDHNKTSGVTLTQYGIDDFEDVQISSSEYSHFSGNGGIGLEALQKDNGVYGFQIVLSSHDRFALNGSGGASVGQFDYGDYYSRQTVLVGADYFAGAGNAVSVRLGAYDIGGRGKINEVVASQNISDNTLESIGGDGIDIYAKATEAVVFEAATVNGNFIESTAGNGISVDLVATGYSTKTHQRGIMYADTNLYKDGIQIEGNAVINTGGNGIYAGLHVSYGGVIIGPSSKTFTLFPIEIDGNAVDKTGGDGIELSMNALGLSGVYAKFSIGQYVGNTVSNTGGYGISVRTSNFGGLIGSGGYIDNNSVDHTGLGGITINNYEYKGGTGIDVYIEHNTANFSGHYAGINVVDDGVGAGSLTDNVAIYHNTTEHNAVSGIGVYATGSANQFDVIGFNTSSHNLVGIDGYDSGSANQTIAVYSIGNTVSDNSIANYLFVNTGTGHQIVH